MKKNIFKYNFIYWFIIKKSTKKEISLKKNKKNKKKQKKQKKENEKCRLINN